MKRKTVVERPCQEFNPLPLLPLGYVCFPYESQMILTFIPFPSLQYVEGKIQGVFKTVIDTAIL